MSWWRAPGASIHSPAGGVVEWCGEGGVRCSEQTVASKRQPSGVQGGTRSGDGGAGGDGGGEVLVRVVS